MATNEPRIDAEEILTGIREWIEIESPSNDALAGAAVQNTLRQPFSLSAQQLLPTGTTD